MAFDSAFKFDGSNLQAWAWRTTQMLQGIMNGKTNNTGSLTLTANAATTTITLPKGRLGEDTIILLSPTSANAATEFGAGSLYVSARDTLNYQFTLTHANNAQTDRTFDFVLVG